MKKNSLHEDLDYILLNTEKFWKNMHNKNLFLTGGTGFFGSWILESIIWAIDNLSVNINALVLTRNYEIFKSKAPHLANHPNIRFHTGDICNFSFPNGDFSAVIHAASDTKDSKNSLSMLDIIIKGTKRTLEFAISNKVEKFLFISSGAVYGKQPNKLKNINESFVGLPSPNDKDSTYGLGKILSEHICKLYSEKYSLDVKIARCFTFIGPYLPLNKGYAVGNFIQDGLRNSQIHIKGDGTPYRSYLYASDLVIWLMKILVEGKTCQPYNVGSPTEITISDLAKSVAKHFHPIPKVIVRDPIIKSNKDPERYVPSIDLIKTELGLTNFIELNSSIEKTIKWYNQ